MTPARLPGIGDEARKDAEHKERYVVQLQRLTQWDRETAERVLAAFMTDVVNADVRPLRTYAPVTIVQWGRRRLELPQSEF